MEKNRYVYVSTHLSQYVTAININENTSKFHMGPHTHSQKTKNRKIKTNKPEKAAITLTHPRLTSKQKSDLTYPKIYKNILEAFP